MAPHGVYIILREIHKKQVNKKLLLAISVMKATYEGGDGGVLGVVRRASQF